MDDKSLLKKIESFKAITKKYNLTANYPMHCYGKLSVKKLSKDGILKFWSRFLKNNINPFLSLYIHIPFCKDSRCRYCMYQSNILRSPVQIDRYLNYLEEEAKFFSPLFSNNKFITLYIGGGTPSVLDTKQLRRLADIIFNNFKFKSNINEPKFKYKGSKCIEMSPATLTQEKILLAKAKGLNRISIGIQSLDKNVLKTANRKFVPFDDLEGIIEFIKVQNFEDFNIDLMAWLPDDTTSKFVRGIEKIMQLDVPSITVYFYRHHSSKFKNTSSSRSYGKYVNYKIPYDRYKLLKSTEPLLKRHSYFSTFDNPNYECQRFSKIGHLGLSYPTQLYWSLRNSTLGLGLHSRSFLRSSVQYSNANTNINKLDF